MLRLRGVFAQMAEMPEPPDEAPRRSGADILADVDHVLATHKAEVP